MKIAYLANIRFPSERAHSVQVAHMCQAFADANCEVDLYVSKRDKQGVQTIQESYGFTERFLVYRLRPKRIYPRLRVSFYMGEFLFALHFLISKKKQYDIIYSRSEWILLILSFLYPAQKLVWESHEAKFNIAAKVILRKKIKTVVISDGIYNFYLQKKIPSFQMVVADDGIDESFFTEQANTQTVRKELELPKDGRIIMYIGGFNPWKGVETFFKTASDCEVARFIAIGGTKDEVNNYKKLYPRVTFLGQKPYKDLARLQQAADVLVIPNTAKNQLSSRFTSPLKLFAHMASGKPLLITDIPSLTSITGWEKVSITEPDNPEAMANSIREVLHNYEDALARALLLKTEAKRYTWQSRASIILTYFEQGDPKNS